MKSIYLVLLAITICQVNLQGQQLTPQAPHSPEIQIFPPSFDRINASTDQAFEQNSRLVHDELPDFEDLFDEVDRFESGTWIIQLGIGARSDVPLETIVKEQDQLDVKPIIPPLSLTVERNIINNVGIGLTIGRQTWKVVVLDYRYHYTSASLRATYHFNIIDSLDPYVGVAATFREMSLKSENDAIKERKFGGTPVIGARYYFSDHFGGFIEIGDDALSWFKVGINFSIN